VGNAEALRNAYIQREASVRSIGLLYYFGFVALTIEGFILLSSLATSRKPYLGLYVVYSFVMALAQLVVGKGIRRLRPWARIGVGIVSGIAMTGWPWGTAFNAYLLYLVFSQKGRMLFTPEYQQAVAQTPDIRCGTSMLIKVVVVLIVLVVLWSFVAPTFHALVGGKGGHWQLP
jgi:hypothetical protein